jgi:transposase
VATKTADQLDLQALHRVRERLVSQRTGIINQIRAFLLERGVAVRQGLRVLRVELPRILATPPDVLSPRMVRIIENLAGDWRRLDERVPASSTGTYATPGWIEDANAFADMRRTRCIAAATITPSIIRHRLKP